MKRGFLVYFIMALILLLQVGCSNLKTQTPIKPSVTPNSTNADTNPEAETKPATPATIEASFMTDDQFINFAIEADKRRLMVLYVQNPDWLKERNLEPKEIKTKDDVIEIMSDYWTERYIEQIWREGSDVMPRLPFGFYMGMDNEGLIKAKDFSVEKISEQEVQVSALLLNMYSNQYDIKGQRTLKLTDEGWRIDSLEGALVTEGPNNQDLALEKKKEWMDILANMNAWLLPNLSQNEVDEPGLILYCGLVALMDGQNGKGEYQLETVYDETLKYDLPKIKKEYLDQVAERVFQRKIETHQTSEPFIYKDGYYLVQPTGFEGMWTRIMSYEFDGTTYRLDVEFYALPDLVLHTIDGKKIQNVDPEFLEIFQDNTAEFKEKPWSRSTITLQEINPGDYVVLENAKEFLNDNKESAK